MNATLTTEAEKQVADACAKVILRYSRALPPFALTLDTLGELLQRLATGESCSLQRVHDVFQSTRDPLRAIEEAGELQMAMAAATVLFEKMLLPGVKEP